MIVILSVEDALAIPRDDREPTLEEALALSDWLRLSSLPEYRTWLEEAHPWRVKHRELLVAYQHMINIARPSTGHWLVP